MVMARRSVFAAVAVAPAWLLPLLLAPGAHAAVCDKTGAPAPAVTTLMASKENPASEAWTVSPSCEVTVSSLTRKEGATETTFLKLTDENIARIESLPTATKGFWLAGYKLAGGADLTNAKELQDVTIASSSLSTVSNIKLPDSVVTMNLERNSITSLANFKLPAQLTSLRLSKNKLTAIDFALPSNLSYLTLDGNPITSIVNVTLSDSLVLINFGTTPISSFEVRASDAALLSGINARFVAVVTQSTCEDTTAVPTEVGGKRLCVISDERFEALYPPKPASEAPTRSSSGSDSATTGSGGSAPTANREDVSTTTTIPESAATDLRGSATTALPSASAGATTVSSSSSTLMIVLVAVGALLAVVIAVVGYRIFVVSPKKAPNHGSDNSTTTSHGKYVSHVESSSAISGSASRGNYNSNPELEQLRNDIRKDGRLAPFRLDERDVQLGSVIARGGFGVIYRGDYRGRVVAVKQLLPDTWREHKMLGRFADEIRLCASLDHPKIVEFVGVTWTSLRDISVVIEFMDGGDLHSVLHGHEQPSRTDWHESWGARRVKSKTAMALDVIEAIAFLHALPTPILHRDLKAHNVLLDARGNAKLSDFGISREIALDHTMTSEIGTVAWIAPEILRGERYSDKADMYSFGVLLVEMDRCRHPYADVGAAQGGTGSACKATQIAVLVSTGELQPSVTSECPDRIRDVVQACVAFDASQRPSASQVMEQIRRIILVDAGGEERAAGFV